MNKFTKSPFNSSLESGVRAVIILNFLFPKSVDLQRLVDFDYLVVHSADADGPDSLHAPAPMRAGELLVRRNIIHDGLMLMMSRGLVTRVPTNNGIEFLASETTNSFVGCFSAPYLLKLKERSIWVANQYGNTSNDELKNMMKSFFDKWTTQFQSIKKLSGDNNG
ncbi:MAG: threonine transporter [Colwellia sp.]|nr:MAG: threonine transporter [Colwellia sp.]